MNVACFSVPRLAALLLLLLLPGWAVVRAQAPAFDRAVGCGQPASGSFYVPQRLAVDAAGNAYVAGYFQGAVQFGATILTSGPNPPPGGGINYDWFVAKLDPLGAVAWAVRAGRATTGPRTCAWTGRATCSWRARPRARPRLGR